MHNHMEQKTMKGKIFVGKVVTVGRPKTVIVSVTSSFRHPLYKKAVKRTHRFAVHNESYQLSVGDTVKIAESRPISRTKHFKVVERLT